MPLDELYDDAPNIGVERGLTVPRLLDLLEARSGRRRNELHFETVAIATAVNAPDKLPDLFKSTGPDEAPEVGKKWWKAERGQGGESGDSK